MTKILLITITYKYNYNFSYMSSTKLHYLCKISMLQKSFIDVQIIRDSQK